MCSFIQHDNHLFLYKILGSLSQFYFKNEKEVLATSNKFISVKFDTH